MNKFRLEIKYGGYICTQTALDFKLNLELKLKTIGHKVFEKKQEY